MVELPSFPSDAEARVGTTLCGGKYRLDSILGIGGMATVYAATHRNQAELAIKILHSDLSADPDVRTRFLREAYAANTVKHRSVVKIVDDDIAEDGSAFLVMERLKGAGVEELRERRGGKVGLDAAVCIVEQLLDVLAVAHAQGIVHRDVKPGNLFVTREGEVKVLDFGIARMRAAVAQGLSLTGAATIMGTPTYMAPEQAHPGMADIDERTDVWAAGATLFALLSGRTVHEGDSSGAVLVKATLERSRSLAAVAQTTPQAIVEVVDCALAFEKKRRWASANDMRTALLAAYRLHLRRAPSRACLVTLVDPVASAGARPAQHADDGRGAAIDLAPTDPAAEAPSLSEIATVPRRTSIPVAADLMRRVDLRRSLPRNRALLVVAGLGAMGLAAWLGRCSVPAQDSPTSALQSAGPPEVVAGEPSLELAAGTSAPAPPPTGTPPALVAAGSVERKHARLDAGGR